ncbi:MAG: hypothetical protein ACUVT7_05205 [Thermoplasmata archaeon]
MVGVAETMANLAGDAIDAASKFVEDVKHACEEVASAVVAGVVAIKEAWDNLDPGLKQWLLLKASIAISMIPGVGIAGILIGCMLDGTFTDMFTAIRTGDWAMLALCSLAFVPGAKALKGLKAVGSFSGKGQKFTRYMSKGELDSVLSTGKIKSKYGATFFTKNVYKNQDTMMKRTAKEASTDKHFVEFRIKNDVQVFGPQKVPGKYGQPGGGYQYWIGEDDVIEADILSYGELR